MDKPPKRKPNRLSNYDYSQNGAYFITICSKERELIFSHITVGTSSTRPFKSELSEIGMIVDNAIKGIPYHYEGVFVDNYVVMPNHIHMIIRMNRDNENNGRAMLVPTCALCLK